MRAMSRAPVQQDCLANNSSADASALSLRLNELPHLDTGSLKAEWKRLYRSLPPAGLSRDLLIRAVAFKVQERAHGSLSKAVTSRLRSLRGTTGMDDGPAGQATISLKPGARLIREWQGTSHQVIVLDKGFEYQDTRYRSLSKIASEITGAHWSGPRFFGIKRRPKPFVRQEAGHE